MAVPNTFLDTYRARLEDGECYTRVSDATQTLLEYEVRHFGLQKFDKVAHGILAFCIDADSSVCFPWLVAPDAPAHDIIGGRHGLVTQEFYRIAEEENLGSYTNEGEGVDYDDLIGTYVIDDSVGEKRFTVICDSGRSTYATPGHIDLIKGLSRTLTDHQILIGAGGETGPRLFVRISDGSALELPYGQRVGLKLETIAASDDILGRSRELENYAKYAQERNFNQTGFYVLVEKAVNAFHDGRRVSLGELCQEILSEYEHDQVVESTESGSNDV